MALRTPKRISKWILRVKPRPQCTSLAACRSFDGGMPSRRTLAAQAPLRWLVRKRALEHTTSPVLAPASVTAGTGIAEALGGISDPPHPSGKPRRRLRFKPRVHRPTASPATGPLNRRVLFWTCGVAGWL